eukprot:Gregarina_sp_Pseudo_9__3003@NODE_3210_length_715_cov_18_073964_g2927_i0_p1_GENE_NODE_3210_length_715_cov_18_073964_g2927_i0NODE_3210_length_715_cov_18_073964_g2927_i0_p1_ORF_typecomplete_len121_score0_63_NODE_3210_length_715_cov_18_073964_g2927_i0306668
MAFYRAKQTSRQVFVRCKQQAILHVFSVKEELRFPIPKQLQLTRDVVSVWVLRTGLTHIANRSGARPDCVPHVERLPLAGVVCSLPVKDADVSFSFGQLAEQDPVEQHPSSRARATRVET